MQGILQITLQLDVVADLLECGMAWTIVPWPHLGLVDWTFGRGMVYSRILHVKSLLPPGVGQKAGSSDATTTTGSGIGSKWPTCDDVL